MAIAFVNSINGGTLKAAGTTLSVTILSNAGELVVLGGTFDNTGTATPNVSSISTPASETATWTIVEADASTASSSGGVRCFIAWILTTVDWSSFSATITWNGSITAKGANGARFTGFPVTPSLRATPTVIPSTTSAPNSWTTANSGDLVFAVGGFETTLAPTGDADTSGGTWSAPASSWTSGGGAATNVALVTQYKIPTTSGTQTYNPTHSSSADSTALAVAFVQPLALSLDVPDETWSKDQVSATWVARLFERSITDAVNAWDGKNLLDETTASFEADSNADGLADGWVIETGSVTCSLVLDPILGTYSQRIVNTGAAEAIIRSTSEWAMSPGGHWSAVAHLKWSSTNTAKAIVGFRNNLGTRFVLTSPNMDTWERCVVANPGFVFTAGSTVHACIVVQAGATAWVDAFRMIPGDADATLTYDSGPNATFTQTQSGSTFSASDNLGLIDGITVDLQADRTDLVGSGDSAAKDLGLIRADNGGLTDTVDTAVAHKVSVSDAAGPTDAAATSLTLDVSDTAGLGDVAYAVLSDTHYDTFTGLDGTRLVDHTSDTGDIWFILPGDGDPADLYLQSGRAIGVNYPFVNASWVAGPHLSLNLSFDLSQVPVGQYGNIAIYVGDHIVISATQRDSMTYAGRRELRVSWRQGGVTSSKEYLGTPVTFDYSFTVDNGWVSDSWGLRDSADPSPANTGRISFQPSNYGALSYLGWRDPAPALNLPRDTSGLADQVEAVRLLGQQDLAGLTDAVEIAASLAVSEGVQYFRHEGVHLPAATFPAATFDQPNPRWRADSNATWADGAYVLAANWDEGYLFPETSGEVYWVAPNGSRYATKVAFDSMPTADEWFNFELESTWGWTGRIWVNDGLLMLGAVNPVVVAYDAAAHAWLAMRLESDAIHYETSPDGLTWTERASSVPSSAVTYIPSYLDDLSRAVIPNLWFTNNGSGAATNYARVYAFNAFPASFADAAGLSDTVTGGPVTVSDTEGLADTAAFAVTLSPGDTLGVTDTRTLDAATSAGDVAGLTDAVSVNLVKTVFDATDPVGLSDSVTAALAVVRDTSDSLGATDSRTLAVDQSRTDAALAGDSRSFALQATRTDPVSGGDNLTTSGSAGTAVTDSVGLADRVDISLQAARADSATLGDTATTILVRTKDVTDTAGPADQFSSSAQYARPTTDAVGLVDGAAVGVSTGAVDPLDLTDAVSAQAEPAAADELGLADSVELVLARAYAASDGAGLRDTLEFAQALGLDITDEQVLTDLVVTLLTVGGIATQINNPRVRVEPAVRTVAAAPSGAVAVEVRSRAATVDSPVRSVGVAGPSGVDLEQ